MKHCAAKGIQPKTDPYPAAARHKSARWRGARTPGARAAPLRKTPPSWQGAAQTRRPPAFVGLRKRVWKVNSLKYTSYKERDVAPIHPPPVRQGSGREWGFRQRVNATQTEHSRQAAEISQCRQAAGSGRPETACIPSPLTPPSTSVPLNFYQLTSSRGAPLRPTRCASSASAT